VVLAGEHEGALDGLALDLQARVGGVLLDDREEVAEQPPLERGEVGALDRADVLGVLGAPDRAAVGRGARRLGLDRRGGLAVAPPVAVGGDRFGQAAWAVVSVRYRSPSSWRRA
jgi:hypothetical protein